MCHCDRYQKRLYRYLRRPGRIGASRRCAALGIVYFILFVVWAALVGGMVSGITIVGIRSYPNLSNSTVVLLPLKSLNKTCPNEIDDCGNPDHSQCVCSRRVDCLLTFPHNITVSVTQLRYYQRCYPEACDTAEFCRFVLGANMTVWPNGHDRWSITPPGDRLAAYITGMVISVIVVGLSTIFFTGLGLTGCCLTRAWMPFPARSSHYSGDLPCSPPLS